MYETLPPIIQQWIHNLMNEKNNNIRYNHYRQLINVKEEIDKAIKEHEKNLLNVR
jgi:hypothetical protein